MKRVRQRHTAPEMALRKWLWRQGYRFRVHNRRLPGTPDLSNSSNRWAIFVNGCFWHGHHGCARATVPKRNREFWVEKIRANQVRDRAKEEALKLMGFAVTTVWECEVDALVSGDAESLNLPLRPRS